MKSLNLKHLKVTNETAKDVSVTNSINYVYYNTRII